MGDPISSVSAVGTSSTLRFTQQAGAAGGQPGELSLSDAARSALDSIGKMHANFDKASASVDAQPRTVSVGLDASRTTEAHPGDAVSEAAKVVSQQIESSMRVQEQLARFVMVSSVSSSFGRNLNMFLRGQ